MSLSDYLKKRGLQLEPMKIGEERKLSDDQLSQITSISEEALILLIQPRLDEIGDELIKNAIPEEVPVLRQAIVEIGGLIDDYRTYKQELSRRKEQTPQKTEEPQTSPPVEEGKEGAL